MRIFKSHPLVSLINGYLVDSPQPSNISYLWNFGSLLGFCLVIQIITGVTLAMHYNPSVLEAFNSVEHIMRDVNNGWLIRYLHANTASAFFFIVYLHIGRGMYYGSYKAPRTLVWTIGTVILILMMAIGFLGYVLPYGQMSLWGATVITNLMSAIPWVGQDIVEFIWGGFSVNNATLNRFFALHFVLPFVLAALALMHLIALHDSAGSGNPLGASGNYDRIPFAPYFIFKDLITIFLFIVILSMFVFFMPNVLGDSENYVMANPMQTPPAIVPEWYLLSFYAILRSIPNKLLGVIAMFSALLALLALPFTDLGRSRGLQFRPLSKMAFYLFVANFLVLLQLGAKHVESPFIELGQFCTFLYFAHFFMILPLISLIENTLIDLGDESSKKETLLQNQPTVFYKIIFFLFSVGVLLNIYLVICTCYTSNSILHIPLLFIKICFLYNFIHSYKTDKKSFFSKSMLALLCLVFLTFNVFGFLLSINVFTFIEASNSIMSIVPWVEIVRGLDFNNITEFNNHFRPIVAALSADAKNALTFAGQVLPYQCYQGYFWKADTYELDRFLEYKRNFNWGNVMNEINNSSVHGDRDFNKSQILSSMNRPLANMEKATSLVRSLGHFC